MFDLKGKVILVTGGASGIGRGVVEEAARAGAKVVFAGRRLEYGRAVEAAVAEAGGEALFVRTDVTQEAEIQQLVASAIGRFGRLDGACNSAGAEWNGSVIEMSADDYRRVFDVNFWGVACALKHEVVAMIGGSGGSIVNISSIVGHVGFHGTSLYNASKHAVEGLTKSAALELARRNVRVNAVAPAFITTPMVERFVGDANEKREALAAAHPVGRLGEVCEVANAVLFLLSDAAPFITGETINIDGGWLAQ